MQNLEPSLISSGAMKKSIVLPTWRQRKTKERQEGCVKKWGNKINGKTETIIIIITRMQAAIANEKVEGKEQKVPDHMKIRKCILNKSLLKY